MRLADILRAQFYIKWNEDGLNCPIDRLFKNNFTVIDDVMGSEYQSWRWLVFDDDVPDNFKNSTNDELNNIIGPVAEDVCAQSVAWVPDICHRHIDLKFDDLPQKIIDIYQYYLSALEYSDEIINIVNKMQFLSDCVGVHIRRGDTIQYSYRNNNTIDKYFDLMDENTTDDFFISTDCSQTQELVIDRYKNRVRFYLKRSFGRDDIAGVQDSLVDLILLSRCKSIYGSYMSTFTEVAWWLGGCKVPVYIVGNL